MQLSPRAHRLLACGVGAALLCALVFHVAMLAIYHSPANLAKLELGRFAHAYVTPLFEQNWHLFSPNPGISHTILATRCQPTGGEWSEWVDPIAPLEAEHDAHPISGLSKLMYVYRGVGRGLATATKKKMADCIDARVEAAKREAAPEGGVDARRIDYADAIAAARPDEPGCGPDDLMAELVELPEFQLALDYTHHVCSTLSGPDLSAIQFKLVEFFPLKYTERDQRETHRWGKVIETVFPEIEGE